jgi:hypothetical protein
MTPSIEIVSSLLQNWERLNGLAIPQRTLEIKAIVENILSKNRMAPENPESANSPSIDWDNNADRVTRSMRPNDE